MRLPLVERGVLDVFFVGRDTRDAVFETLEEGRCLACVVGEAGGELLAGGLFARHGRWSGT